MIVMADLVIKKKILQTGKIKKILTIRTEPKQKLNILISKKRKETKNLRWMINNGDNPICTIN